MRKMEFFGLRCFLAIIAVLFDVSKVCFGGQYEKQLLHQLLDQYNTLERPVTNESDPLQLSFGLTLMQIIDVDEKNQLLITNIWLKLEWTDVNLRWNASEYGNVKDLRIPPHRIWKPDVLMYNSADEGFDGTYPTNVVVKNNGSCLYIPPGIFKSTCKIDITWFPFDDQHCTMKFGSWTYDGFQLDLQLQDDTGGDLSSFITNGEWDLLSVPGKRNEIFYNCCPEPYVDITFVINIRRRTLYYFFNLIVPCVLIASMAVLGFTLPPDSGEKLSLGLPAHKNVAKYACCPNEYDHVLFTLHIRRRTIYYLVNLIAPCILLASMTLLEFLLPNDCGEKLTLGITILLSLTVFLNMVAETMPATSEAVPLLGITVLLSLTVFLNMVAETMPVTSDAVPLLGVTILLSLTVFHNLVAETLPQVSDAMPVLGVTILLSLSVFSLMIADALPQTSEAIPLLGTYFNCIMFMVASSVVSTILILNYHHRNADTHEMTTMVKILFLTWLPWILRMSRPVPEEAARDAAHLPMPLRDLELRDRSSKSLLANVLDIDDDFRHNTYQSSSHHHTSYYRPEDPSIGSGASPGVGMVNGGTGSSCIGPHRELSLILKELRTITDKIKRDEEASEITNDWKFAAMVVDRLCLIIFTLFTIIATIAVLMSAPHIIVQ